MNRTEHAPGPTAGPPTVHLLILTATVMLTEHTAASTSSVRGREQTEMFYDACVDDRPNGSG